jgi:hypothetical protein
VSGKYPGRRRGYPNSAPPARCVRRPHRLGARWLRHACGVPVHPEIDRATGALLGTFAGDALGMPFEGRAPAAIADRLTMLAARGAAPTPTTPRTRTSWRSPSLGEARRLRHVISCSLVGRGIRGVVRVRRRTRDRGWCCLVAARVRSRVAATSPCRDARVVREGARSAARQLRPGQGAGWSAGRSPSRSAWSGAWWTSAAAR